MDKSMNNDQRDENIPLMKMEKNKGKFEYQRTISSIKDPQAATLEALKNGDIDLFRDLVNETVVNDGYKARKGSKKIVDIELQYEEENDKTLLQVAVDEEKVEALQILLDAGADANRMYLLTRSAPIHVASRKGNRAILDLLLTYGGNVNAVTSDGKTCLHILATKCVSSSGEKTFIDCLSRVLNSKGVQVDRENKIGETPLTIACGGNDPGNGTSFEAAQLLAKRGADVLAHSSLLNKAFGGARATELIETAADLPPTSIALTENLRKMLDEAHISEETEESNFQKFDETVRLATKAEDLMNAPPGEMNVLQVAANYGLDKYVRCLLEYPGINPNKASKSTLPALLRAALDGEYKVIQALLDHKKRYERTSDVPTARFDIIEPDRKISILHAILRKEFSSNLIMQESSTDNRYEECLKIIWEEATQTGRNNSIRKELKRIINLQDTLRNTALHYATQLWTQEVVRYVLELGANIGIKNEYDEVPISHILPETMESFLDEFCLKSEGNVTNNNFKITARFDFIAPPKPDDTGFSLTNREDSKENNQPSITTKENEWVDDEKKEAIQMEDVENQEKVTNQEEDERLLPECDGLWYMGQSKKHKHLLKHPVVALFLAMKWRRMGTAYNRNLYFYTAFVAFLTGYIFTLYGGDTIRMGNVFNETVCKNDPKTNVTTLQPDRLSDANVVWGFVVFFLVFVILRELLQLGVAPRRYFFSFENWLEMTLIVLTSILLFLGDYCQHIETKRHISAIVIVLSWSELITMVGRHPALTIYNIYVTMFYKVLQTFIRFLVWYSLFIVSFGLGFYILLHRDSVTLSEKKKEGKEEEFPFFDGLGTALVKTFTMFVGELEFADLPFKTAVGYIFLLAFVFLIVVVMMNLLNGLAVSDTGVIREEAEIYAYKCQVEIISYLEAMMLGDPFNFLSNWPSYIWLRKLPCNCSPIGGLYRIPSIRNAINSITKAKNMLLFGSNQILAMDYCLTFWPNQENFRCRNLLCCCACGNCSKDEDGAIQSEAELLPTSVVESAKELVISLRKQENNELTALTERLGGIENTLKVLMEQMAKIKKE